MKKVFASDFDGTLYFYQAEVKLPPESVRKIKEYQSAGNLFGLCTGRQIGGLTPFIGGILEPDFYITASGSYIVDRNFHPVFEREMSRETADAIIRKVRPEGNRLTLDVGGEICVFDKMDYPGKYYVITGAEDLPAGKIHQVSIHTGSPEEAAEWSRWINVNFEKKVEAFQNVAEVDIAPSGCSKGNGVRVLRNTVPGCRLYGIGDSVNDLPLIREADRSYTFPYAPGEVQEQADFVVENIVQALEDSLREQCQEDEEGK